MKFYSVFACATLLLSTQIHATLVIDEVNSNVTATTIQQIDIATGDWNKVGVTTVGSTPLPFARSVARIDSGTGTDSITVTTTHIYRFGANNTSDDGIPLINQDIMQNPFSQQDYDNWLIALQNTPAYDYNYWSTLVIPFEVEYAITASVSGLGLSKSSLEVRDDQTVIASDEVVADYVNNLDSAADTFLNLGISLRSILLGQSNILLYAYASAVGIEGTDSDVFAYSDPRIVIGRGFAERSDWVVVEEPSTSKLSRYPSFSVPEPQTLTLALFTLIGLVLSRIRKRQ